MWLLIHVRIKINPCKWPRVFSKRNRNNAAAWHVCMECLSCNYVLVFLHFNGNIAILTKFSSLGTPQVVEVVSLTAFVSTRDDNLSKLRYSRFSVTVAIFRLASYCDVTYFFFSRQDVFKFMVTFVLIFLAFMVGLHNLYWYYEPSIRGQVEVVRHDVKLGAEKGFGT